MDSALALQQIHFCLNTIYIRLNIIYVIPYEYNHNIKANLQKTSVDPVQQNFYIQTKRKKICSRQYFKSFYLWILDLNPPNTLNWPLYCSWILHLNSVKPEGACSLLQRWAEMSDHVPAAICRNGFSILRLSGSCVHVSPQGYRPVALWGHIWFGLGCISAEARQLDSRPDLWAAITDLSRSMSYS